MTRAELDVVLADVYLVLLISYYQNSVIKPCCFEVFSQTSDNCIN